MDACEACAALNCEPASVEPHSGLVGGAVHVRTDGTLERYACGDCGSLWERLRPRPANHDKSHAWTLLMLPRTRVRPVAS